MRLIPRMKKSDEKHVPLLINSRNHTWGRMLTLASQQRGAAAKFAGDLGKGCEAINLVPFWAFFLCYASFVILFLTFKF